MSPGKKRGETTTRTDLIKEMAAYSSPMSARKVPFKKDVENKDGEVVDEETRDRNTAQEVALDDAHMARDRAAAQASILPNFKGMFGKKDKVHEKGYYGLFIFFNSQYCFHQTFSNKSVLLPSNPTGSSDGRIRRN